MTNISNGIIDSVRLREFDGILQRYRSGKASVERRCIAAENWWRLRNSAEEARETEGIGGFKAVSGWLHNVLVSKHADAMDAYPAPTVLPREPGDRRQAELLGKLLPLILEQNGFEQVYSDTMWQKLKTGTGVYKVVWNPEKLNGLGDIDISRVDLLNIFWEPGVADIQQSAHVFHTWLADTNELRERYPELSTRPTAQSFTPSRFHSDDAALPEGRSLVIEVWYKKRGAVHCCRYVGDTLLYSSENMGLPQVYSHGLYPFVFDSLFPVEGSPCGYGFIDLCRNSQTQIDLLQSAFIRNTMVGAVPRYFRRIDGAVSDAEFLDLSRPLVTVDGNLGDDSLRPIDYRPLSGNYLQVRQNVIEELRETSGNTETSSGVARGGVTAASAIAALQEASGKGSRDASRGSYRSYGRIIELCIELIRQFYDMPRQFRITGGQFMSFDNAGLLPQSMGSVAGVELGLRKPVFDVKVSAQRQSPYNRLSQNELALQFYNLGFFEPQRARSALSCLEMMDFEGKDELRGRIERGLLETMQRESMARAMARAPGGAAAAPAVPGLGQREAAAPAAVKATSAAIPGGNGL